METILLLGSSGLLGSHLNKFFSQSFKVIKFKRTEKKILQKKNSLRISLKKNNFDIIINLSALTDVDYCEKNRRKSL